MAHILETFFSCLPKSLWEDGMVYQGVSMAIRVMCQGPQSLGLERSWLISRMKKSAVWPVPSHPCFHSSTRLLLSPVLSSGCFCSTSSSIFPVLHLVNTLPCDLYLRLQMPPLPSTIILHLPNFSLVLLLCSIFDIYFHLFRASHLRASLIPFFTTFGSLHPTFTLYVCKCVKNGRDT